MSPSCQQPSNLGLKHLVRMLSCQKKLTILGLFLRIFEDASSHNYFQSILGVALHKIMWAGAKADYTSSKEHVAE